MRIDPTALSPSDSYQVLTSVVLPRPIAFVSTLGENGVFNAAPFSSYTTVSRKPPMICLSLTRREGEKKDTLRNIEYTRDFVVNVVDYDLARAINIAAADYPSEISEIAEAGLHALPSEKVRSPRIAESPINMECKLVQILEFGDPPSSLIIGEVVQFHVRDDLYSEGKIDPLKLRPLGRLCGDLFCRTHDVFEMKRGVYKRS